MVKKLQFALLATLTAAAIVSPALAQAAPRTFAATARVDSSAATGGGSVGYNHARLIRTVDKCSGRKGWAFGPPLVGVLHNPQQLARSLDSRSALG
jgi:hypothetical protein